MVLKRAVGVVGGALAVGGGLYYTIQLDMLAGLEYAERKAQVAAEEQKKKITTIDTQTREQQALIATLQQRAEVERRSTAQLRSKLESARREVQLLETQLSDRESGLAAIFQEAKAAQERIEALGKDRLRSTEAVRTYEKDLEDARRKVAETKEYLNPLNHPAVKDLMKQFRSP